MTDYPGSYTVDYRCLYHKQNILCKRDAKTIHPFKVSLIFFPMGAKIFEIHQTYINIVASVKFHHL